MRIQSLGWEDPLEEGIATHSSILAQRIPWTEEPGVLQSIGSQRVRHYRDNLARSLRYTFLQTGPQKSQPTQPRGHPAACTKQKSFLVKHVARKHRFKGLGKDVSFVEWMQFSHRIVMDIVGFDVRN